MRRPLAAATAVLAAVTVAACGNTRLDKAPPSAPGKVRLTSAAFGPGGTLPRRFTCDGAGETPPLRWAGVPAEAAQLALVVTDPDAPGGRYVHWTLYGLPPQLGALPAGAPSLAGALQGKNSAGKVGWTPPCPPRGTGEHRYEFDLYWLTKPLKVGAGADPNALALAIKDAAGGRGHLVARYGRLAAAKR